MSDKPRVLFVCVHNGGRSQMAEALLRALGGERFEAHSAGLEPGALNPLVVEAMREIGIDLSKARAKGVSELLELGAPFDWVITVCDETSAERCPVFPGASIRLHWSFRDPAAFQGTPEERLAQTRFLREEIRIRVEDFLRKAR